VMDDAQRARVGELLELVSRTVEANPGASAPTIRTRAHVKRQGGHMALDLLAQGGFIERRRVNAEDTYHSVKPYRVSTETPKASFGATHASGQGGSG
jgi:glycine/serine hydroxymethyltransferase